MENKINLVELLKDCPKGMELDCTMFENLYFDYILKPEDLILCYTEYDNIRTSVTFNRYGAYSGIRQAKCVIFPKGKTSWKGFQKPFKDGDIITCTNAWVSFVAIFKKIIRDGESFERYCVLILKDNRFKASCRYSDFKNPRLATEEERNKLFDAIRVNGFRWNAETKTLEKLVVPNFKVGDKIKHKYNNTYCTLGEYSEGISAYRTNIGLALTYKDLEHWELVPDKFDINTLKIFESKVLVRSGKHENWRPAMFGGIEIESHDPYVTVGGSYFKYLIPYEGNEHLLLSKNDCDDFYKTWE